jgi:hypothetical protein
MITGLTLGALLSQIRGYRLGGVMVLPILAIYTFRELLSPVIFILATVAAWISLWAFQEYTLNYGRRLFLSALITGVVVTIFTGYALSKLFPGQFLFETTEVVASIFPGITAFNLMRVNPEERRVELMLIVCGYLALVIVGLLSLWALADLAIPTPPLLTLPTSDITTWIGIEPRGGAYPVVIPNWIILILLPVAVIIYEGFRQRYHHRLVGIIIIPTLGLFSVQFAPTIVIYAIGATTVFYIISYIHWMTLIYGRVLLTISIFLGTVYSLITAVFVSQSVPGATLFFTGLFVGIGAYNLNRVSPKTRVAHIRIDAGLFVMGYIPLFMFIDIPVTGLLHDGHVLYIIVGVMIIALAATEIYRLEQSTPDVAAFASGSAFAHISPDRIESHDSPLVADTEEDT